MKLQVNETPGESRFGIGHTSLGQYIPNMDIKISICIHIYLVCIQWLVISFVLVTYSNPLSTYISSSGGIIIEE